MPQSSPLNEQAAELGDIDLDQCWRREEGDGGGLPRPTASTLVRQKALVLARGGGFTTGKTVLSLSETHTPAY